MRESTCRLRVRRAPPRERCRRPRPLRTCGIQRARAAARVGRVPSPRRARERHDARAARSIPGRTAMMTYLMLSRGPTPATCHRSLDRSRRWLAALNRLELPLAPALLTAVFIGLAGLLITTV